MLSLSKRALSRCQLINVFVVGSDASSSSKTDFLCRLIQLVGKRQLDTALDHELTFSNPVHHLDAS